MIDFIEWFRLLIVEHRSLEYAIIFLGAGFGGEFALLALGFLAAQGVISIFPLFLFSFLGTFFSDSLWFLIGRTKVVSSLIRHRYADTTISIINEALKRISRGSHLATLVMAKFLMGTRVLLIMYVSTTQMSFSRFIRSDSIAILVWIFAVAPVGLLLGFGFTYIAGILENLYWGIGFILLMVIIIFILEIWIKRMLTKPKD